MVEERDVGSVLDNAEAEGAEVLDLLLLDKRRAGSIDGTVEGLCSREACLERVDTGKKLVPARDKCWRWEDKEM